MENKYADYASWKSTLKALGKVALAAYVIGGSVYNSDKTGHPSADLATGRSQPTKLEKTLINFVLDTFNLPDSKLFKHR